MFEKGKSGNPAGRPRGARDKRNEAIASAIQKALDSGTVAELVEKALEQAKEGRPALLLGLMEYGFSKMPRLLHHSGQSGGPVKFIVDIAKL